MSMNNHDRLGLNRAIDAISSVLEGDDKEDMINMIKDKVKNNYPEYPKGIEGFGYRKRENVVTIELTQPLDLDELESILARDNYESEISKDGDHRVLNFYSVQEYSSGAKGKQLQGTFHETKEIPLTNSSSDEINEKGEYIINYLKELYS